MYVIEYGSIRVIRRGTKIKEGALAVGVWYDTGTTELKERRGERRCFTNLMNDASTGFDNLS